MRRKLSWIMLAILLFGLVAIRPINQANAPILPNVFVDPPETKDSGIGVGSTFTVKVNISNVVELFGWQINMTYNPAVVNTTTTSIVEGPFLKQAGLTQLLAKKVNTTAGTLLVSYMLKLPYPANGASGNGTLVSITFKVRAVERITLLQFVKGTKLNTVVGGNLVPINHTTEDGIFDNRTGNAPPVAGFSVDPTVANVSDAIEFDASASYDPDAWLVSYHWDYGDGKSEIYMRERYRNVNLTAVATHIYNHAGVYTVTLTVTDSDGATAVATADVTIKGHDVAIVSVKASHVAVMPGVPVTVNVTVANNGYPYAETFDITAYYNETAIGTQNIVDLAPQTQTKLIFPWDTTGISLGKYIIKANTTIIDDYDTSNNEYIDGSVTISLTNIVDYPVTVGGFTFHVIAESTSTTNNFEFNQTEKKISFNVTGETGTGGFSNVTIPTDLLGGSYTVSLDASDVTPEPQITTNGTHTFIYFTYIHAAQPMLAEINGTTVATPPVAVFTVSTTRAIADTPITFNATDSYDPDGTIKGYQWDFNDGNITTVDTPILTHAYTQAGDYTVTLTVKDNKQLTNSTQNPLTIIDYPEADFTYSPTIPLKGQTITFDASTSQPNGGSIETYTWEFGDGSTGIGAIVTHAYVEIGNYAVVLNVTDTEGLWNTKTKTVMISLHNIAMTGLIATPTSVKIGQQVSVSITVVNAGNFTETFEVTGYYNSTLMKTISVVNLPPATTNTTTIAWNTAGVAAGPYTLKANASIVAGESVTTDNSLVGSTVTVLKLDTQLTLSASLTTLTLGENTTLSGTFTPVRSSFHIKILYRQVGETAWSIAGGTPTDSKSQYTFEWAPSAAGDYEVKANWQGDANTSPSDSNMQQISVKEPPASINFYYILIPVVIIVIVAVAVYFLKFRK